MPLVSEESTEASSALQPFFEHLCQANYVPEPSLKNANGRLDKISRYIKSKLSIADSFIKHILLGPNIHLQTIQEQLKDSHSAVLQRLSTAITSLLETGLLSVLTSAEKQVAMIYAKTRHRSVNDAMNGTHPSLLLGQLEESCSMCEQPIHFEDYWHSRCESGHPFCKCIKKNLTHQTLLTGLVRCSLTLLSIQSPGISKVCGLCQRQYLKESFFLGPEVNANFSTGKEAGGDVTMSRDPTEGDAVTSDYPTEPTLRLFEALVAACDFCLYCGGRFIG